MTRNRNKHFFLSHLPQRSDFFISSQQVVIRELHWGKWKYRKMKSYRRHAGKTENIPKGVKVMTLPMGLDFTKPITLIPLTTVGGRGRNNFSFLPTFTWFFHVVVLHWEICFSVLPLVQNSTHFVKRGETFSIMLGNSNTSSSRLLFPFLQTH